MGLEGHSTLCRNSLPAAVGMCAWAYFTELEPKLWLPSSSSVTVKNSAKSRLNEFWFSFGWLGSLQTSPFLTFHPAQTAGCPLCPCNKAVQGKSTEHRMWTQSCVCPFFTQAPGQPRTRCCLAAIDTPNTCCWGLAWVSRTRTAPCLLPSLRFHWTQSGCINLISLEIQSENKLRDLGKEELPGSVTVAILQLHL